MTIGSNPETLLEGRNLYCERDERVLFEQLSFSVQGGQLLQVKGSNGSGKTTLLRILCGLNDSFEGELYFQGQLIEEQRDQYLASLLYIGHRSGVSRILSPRENLRWSGALHYPIADADIDDALAEVGLRGYEDVPCHNLSAGQQQRVSLARLLIGRAVLWILDEPFTTLDVHAVAQLEVRLAHHVKNGGAVLVTTHHDLKVDCRHDVLDLDASRVRSSV
ncbi:cytochrome c biogenesis heme-transporting ATPase CcmA [Pseudohongiella nitratireducens]|uniref:cytochrome c biogenesis heme-transporting ATPase CcmA n=1 Tax=Pseudohongiella nitratireducens TaxID=1768907 RepID=UPI0030EDF6E4